LCVGVPSTNKISFGLIYSNRDSKTKRSVHGPSIYKNLDLNFFHGEASIWAGINGVLWFNFAKVKIDSLEPDMFELVNEIS
jgi:hypothetical protein